MILQLRPLDYIMMYPGNNKDDLYSRARKEYCFEYYPVYQQYRLPFSVV